MLRHLWFSLQGPMLILSTRHVRFAVSQWCREGWWCQGRKMKMGRLQLCIRGVDGKTCLEETWKAWELVWSQEALRSHFKSSSLRRCKQTKKKNQNPTTEKNISNSSWWMIAGGENQKYYSNQTGTKKNTTQPKRTIVVDIRQHLVLYVALQKTNNGTAFKHGDADSCLFLVQHKCTWHLACAKPCKCICRE